MRPGIVLVLVIGLGLGDAAAQSPLSSSRLGYVPPKSTGTGILHKIQNLRIRRSQRLLSKLESLTPERRKPSNLFGLIKRGCYHNMVLRGATKDGAAVTIIAGKHRGFPFVSTVGNWDNVQLKVGDRTYAIHGKNLPHLKIGFGGQGVNKRVTLSYDGPITEQQVASHRMGDHHRRRLPEPVKKQTRTASLRLELDAQSLGLLPMGLPGVMGMEYFPRKVQSRGDGQVLAIGGRRLSLSGLSGEMETGRMSNLSARRGLTAVYDYRGLSAESGNGHVKFTGRGAGSGKKSKLARVADRLFDGIARFTGTRKFGFDARGNIRHDQKLPLAEGKIVDHDVIKFDNGVTLERRMVEAKDRAGNTHRGLQERFF